MTVLSIFLLCIYLMDKAVAETENCTKFDFRCDNKLLVKKLSDVLALKFNEMVINELGREYSNNLDPRPLYKENFQHESLHQNLNVIVEKLHHKLSSAKKILTEMNKVSDENSPSYIYPCPFTSLRSVHPKSSINIFRNIEHLMTNPRLNVLGYKANLKVKRQYFLAHLDHATDKSCATLHSNLRYLYHKVVHPDPKLIIFIIDTSVSLETLFHAVSVVKEISRALQAIDMMALKTTNSTDFIKFRDVCSISSMSDIGNATENNKLLLTERLATIDVSDVNIPLHIINNELEKLVSQDNLPVNKLFIYLTDAKVLINETWTKVFPFNIYEENMKFAIGSIHENQMNNITSLEILHFENRHNQYNNHSVMRLHINDSGIIGQVASAFISLLPQNYVQWKMQIEEPIWEATAHDFMIPLVLPLSYGILGVDLHWSDLAEDLLYFKGFDENIRAFVIDFAGNVLMHTYFPRPVTTSEKIKFTKIDNLERPEFINELKTKIFTNDSGTISLNSDNYKSIMYTWKWVSNLYIVCIVSEQNTKHIINNKTNSACFPKGNKDILLHRLDLFPPKNGKICRHFKQISTLDQGTIYLSPSSFLSPFNYLYDMSDGQEAIQYMQNYLAYLRSVAHGLLSNPGLKNEVQQDVSCLNSILSFFKRQHLHGLYSKYVVRRYAVTKNGVLAMFPGTVLEYDYEPVKRPWYTFALKHPGKVILTPPNLDVGGAGYVVSISYAIPSKNYLYPWTVLSMDVTMGFLYKLLIDSLPLCGMEYMKCFIMNNQGYLVSHPELMDPNSSGPIEQQHITHKESMIAIDMLNQKGFVTKRLCNNFYDKTIQRYYDFNSSLPHVLSNVVTSDHCVHYYIAAIPGTNSFIGLVNTSCTAGAFCPCSLFDRLCLNCNRMEQTECECPCECSSEPYECPLTNVSKLNNDIPTCGMTPEHNNHKSHYFHNFAENLKSCFDFQCDSYSTHFSCLGILGCEWCQIDVDGRTPLSAPFCTPQSSCFNGVLGAVTPYGEGHLNRDPLNTYSAIGPIAGCIVIVSLIIAVALYCYRQNVSSDSCHNLYVDGPAEVWADPDVQMNQLPSDDMHDFSGQDKLLPSMEIEAPISPYRVVTGYRRPHNCGGSDHGYSTMTPHEDSETTGFSGNEPIILSDDTKSDVSCPIPSKIKPRTKCSHLNDPGFTVLPCGKNSIIAPVTVHRHMEAS